MNGGGPQKISMSPVLGHGKVHLPHPASEEELGGQEWTDGWVDRWCSGASLYRGLNGSSCAGLLTHLHNLLGRGKYIMMVPKLHEKFQKRISFQFSLIG